MTTLPELLRKADPVANEPMRTAQERRTARFAVLNAPRFVERPPQRRAFVVAIAAGILTAVGAGFFGWSRTTVDLVAAVRFEARLAEEQPADGLREAIVGLTGRKIYLHSDAILANGDIAGAQVVPGDTASTFGVAIALTRDGASKIFSATQGHIGKPIAILIDGQVLTAPTLRAPISSAGVISGDFTKAEAERIASGILGR